jgi:hypothetical protein
VRRYHSSVWGDNRTFKQWQAYVDRLKRAGLPVDAAFGRVGVNHPSAGFQD